jgi:hypothetical protein
MYHYEIFWIQHSIPASSTAGFVTRGHKRFRPCLRAFPYAMIVVLLSDNAAILVSAVSSSSRCLWWGEKLILIYVFFSTM